ncbi:hypothetical protein GH714_034177 [Hevea brasiliensis]|uniref:Uncharacterized protein n=1 Tax=Hevea brasiliensis TaxID=3981 RepID=A0A6A6K851_HEVBR|nr:hypothetical protein GH714_034177 [Hevea brasiliensis]
MVQPNNPSKAPIEDIHIGRREELEDRGGGQSNENISDDNVIHSPDLDEVDINDGFIIHENYEVDPLNEELLSVRDKINHKVLEDNVDDGSDFNDEVVKKVKQMRTSGKDLRLSNLAQLSNWLLNKILRV